MTSETEKAIRQYHAYLVKNLIYCGIVIHPMQISALMANLNGYVVEQKEGKVQTTSRNV